MQQTNGTIDKREEIRRKYRNEYKEDLLRQLRAEWRKEIEGKIPFNKEQVFLLCSKDDDQGYQRLGDELLELGPENMLAAETFGKMLRYSKCKYYSWVVLITVYFMVDMLDDYTPLLQAYLPIIDKLIEQGNLGYTIERGISALYMMSRIKEGPELIVRMPNFKNLLNEYVYSKDQKRMQLQSIEIVSFCLQKLTENPVDLRIMIKQGVLNTIADLLASGFKHQEFMLEGLKGMIKYQELQEDIMANEELLKSFRMRFCLGNPDVKFQASQIWRELFGHIHTENVLKLINLGVVDHLVTGVKGYAEDIKSAKVCLQAINLILERLRLCTMNEIEFQLLIKSLQQRNFSKTLTSIQAQNKILSQLSQNILRTYFDYDSMIVQ